MTQEDQPRRERRSPGPCGSGDELHPVLARQLRRVGVADHRSPPGPEGWCELLTRVSRAYFEADQERYLVQRSMEVSSREMRALHDQLAAERDKLQQVIAAMGEGLCQLDAHWRIRFCNPAAEALLTVRGGLLGRDLFQTVAIQFPPPLEGMLTCERLATALARGEACQYEDVRLVREDGSEVPAACAFRPMVQDGKLDSVVLIVRDTTMTLRAESLRRQREAADAANHAKSAFLANVSHELRTPLHGILSFARFGMRDACGGDRAELADYFEQINESGSSLLALLNDLLDLAKLDVGKMTFTFAESDMNDLVEAALSEVEAQAAERGIILESPEPDAPCLLDLDQARMRQVLRNLLSNALKFSPDGGTIRVEIERQASGVRVEVRDQGPGIPEEELETIFDKFVQSTKTRSGAGGTGLGLAICREILAAHRGRIWAENLEEGGSRLVFVVPGELSTMDGDVKASAA